MKILFVSREKANNTISSIVKNQGESLSDKGIELTYFIIGGLGIKGYIRSIFELRKIFKKNEYNLIHAHYSLSGFTAALSGAKPLVVSLMGSDVKSKTYYRYIINFFNSFFWTKTIVKSVDMKISLKSNSAIVIPNGVDFNTFKPIKKEVALLETNWDINKRNILFAANPKRAEKNFKLAERAFNLLDNKNVALHYLENVPNNKMKYYFNSSDVILLTSLWEGSPNVIKEAMACNLPIVGTDVGDIKEVIESTDGCYICSFDADDVASKLREALNFDSRTDGRLKIEHLDSQLVAEQVIEVYKSAIA